VAMSEAGVRRIALSLPEAAEAPHHDMASFRVMGKIFATVPPTSDRVHIFVNEEETHAYCAEYPGVVEELRWGKRLSGSRVWFRGATQTLLREMLEQAWRTKAPKKLLAELEGP